MPEFLSNTATGRHLDFFADYAVSGQVTANLRLSYTDWTNTLAEASDFKGWTGRLAARWQATGKLALSAYASRDVGFDSYFGSVTVVPPGSPPGTPPVTRLYDNNRLTYSGRPRRRLRGDGESRRRRRCHYTRAELVSVASDVLAAVESTDRKKIFYIGANYAFLRNGIASCRLARELRDVSGGNNYSYGSTLFGCTARWVLRG